MTQYAPPGQQQQYMYYAQQHPTYNPGHQQQQWGNQQGAQQHYNTSTTQLNQNQSMTGEMPPPSYQNAQYGDVNPDSGLPAKFNPRPRYNDCWAFVLFIAQLAAFIVLSYYAIDKISDDRNMNGEIYLQPGSRTPYFAGNSDNFYWKQGLVAVLIGILTGLVVAVVYFFITQAFPRQVIKVRVTFALSIIAQLAVAVYFFVRREWMPAAFGLFFALLYASMWFFWKSRIPFATEMLIAVTSISKKYKAMFAMSFLGLFIQTAYSAYFMVVISGCYELYYDRTARKTPAKLKILIFFCFVSFYWTSQVIKNIVHITISGVYACYYFLMGSPQGMSKSPTIESFKRACTTSIGSICFGSLIVAAIQTLRAIVQLLRSNGDDGFMVFIACLLDCIIACLQGIIEYVNKYAYCQVAIYGKAYIPAARDTWNILKDRGIVQIINDNLVGNVWAMGAIMSGMLSALGSYVYIWFANPDFDNDDSLTYVIVTMAFVMGFQMVYTVGVVIDSGCATTFVCLAEDPAALARTKPATYLTDMTLCSTSSTMAAMPASKKGRRFSLIRLFNNSSNTSTSSGSVPLSSMDEEYYRYSMDPSPNSSSASMDSMQTEMMRERRKSIATLTENSFRSKSFDLRPSAMRPILSRKEAPQTEMNEKMKQFDELLQTRRTCTIRLTLTPSLLQEP
ncbi:putative choline transporter, neither null mutation nor overexpression affects choline transport [Mortierella sp. AM989]|nr:putative choline transporter, neither null mutation nor overexpression affects choline transport [Mortierella sp. AM989]